MHIQYVRMFFVYIYLCSHFGLHLQLYDCKSVVIVGAGGGVEAVGGLVQRHHWTQKTQVVEHLCRGHMRIEKGHCCGFRQQTSVLSSVNLTNHFQALADLRRLAFSLTTESR